MTNLSKHLKTQHLKDTILRQMATVENETGKMFHEYNSRLESEIMESMDSNSAARMNETIKTLDVILADPDIDLELPRGVNQ